MLIVIGVAAFVVMVMVVISQFNAIVRHANAASRAWAGIVAYERQKNLVIPALETVIEQSKVFESSLQSSITKMRSAVSGLSDEKIDPAAVAASQQASQSVLRGIGVTVEAYPHIESIDLLKNLMNQLAAHQENVTAAITIFNSTVEDHNNAIESFPASVVNQLFNHRKPIPTFSDQQAEADFAYSPKL